MMERKKMGEQPYHTAKKLKNKVIIFGTEGDMNPHEFEKLWKNSNMKTFVVAIVSLFDNDLKQFKIQAETDVLAVKQALIDSCKSEEGKQEQIEWNKTIGETIKEVENTLHDDCDTLIHVIEI